MLVSQCDALDHSISNERFTYETLEFGSKEHVPSDFTFSQHYRKAITWDDRYPKPNALQPTQSDIAIVNHFVGEREIGG